MFYIHTSDLDAYIMFFEKDYSDVQIWDEDLFFHLSELAFLSSLLTILDQWEDESGSYSIWEITG